MDYKDINDYEVLYMIKENDDDAVELLYNKYKPVIDKKVYKWKAVLKKLGISPLDIRQELYLAFTKAVNKYSEQNDTLFYTYVNILLDGHIKNIIKKASKVENTTSYIVYNDNDEEISLVDLIKDDTYQPSNNIDVTDLLSHCKDFSTTLSFEQAIVFEMHLAGYKNNEIAQVVDKKNATVTVEISRILKKFKNYLVKNKYLVV